MREAEIGCPVASNVGEEVLLAHGGGGALTQQLIDGLFRPVFDNSSLVTDHDGAVLSLGNTRLAFSTDSYVVRPCFFPGGDIGSLAVHGTINDLSMCGARPLYLSVALILEEGFPMASLKRIVASMQSAATADGVRIVTGDTKVVDKGHGDGVYINTSGIGVVEASTAIGPASVCADDVIIVSGDIGRHGMAVMSVREGLSFEQAIISDSASLYRPVRSMLDAGIQVHCLRDATRGGVATALVEIAEASGRDILIDEAAIPVSDPVRGACEILGLDPLYVANEGRFIVIVPASEESQVLEALHAETPSSGASVIGRVMQGCAGDVTATTVIGGRRALDRLSGEQLPRIC